MYEFRFLLDRFWVTRAAAEAIFLGLPISSTTTTASTSMASTEAGILG